MNTPALLHSDRIVRSGQGVVLRRLDPQDLAAFQAYRGDVELGRYQGWSPLPEAEAQAFLAAMSEAPLLRRGEWMQLGIAEPGSPRLLGDIGLYLSDDARQAEIGFTLSRAAQGRGLATAAVRAALALLFESGVERVVGVTDARNAASIALLLRVGMRKCEERNVGFRGEPCVELVFAIERNGSPPIGT